jgi:thiosulfate dehydrogenase
VNESDPILSQIRRLLWMVIALVCVIAVTPFVIYYTAQVEADPHEELITASAIKQDAVVYWIASDIHAIEDTALQNLVAYGEELIKHTAVYLGPHGAVSQTTNGLNCQNCHLDAGTKVFGNNFGSVASLYPKFRARSGAIESIYKRVNDCVERSLNGKQLDTNSKEMLAIEAYIVFLGSNVKKGEKANGSGLKDIVYLDRASDPKNGAEVYKLHCERCHQANGQGELNAEGTEFTYPALWGNNSYSDGAGLYRISNFAKYVKCNMPFEVTYQTPVLSDEEAYDVAAFVNSQPRPHFDISNDWPDISLKPIDHPFGPYTDTFSESQHKYGPYEPIAALQKKREIAKAK